MMRKISLVIFLLWMTIGCSQSHVKHVVAKGETITQIAQKYKVTPYDIYQLNPDAKSGIQENSVLIIPSKATFKELKKTHTVQSKETFFSIAKQYNVSVESLEKANPTIDKSALSVGTVLMIPSTSDVVAKPTETTTGVKPVYHIVQPKETKFGIAKQYNTTVENLEKLNPEIISGLPEGYKLIILQQIQVSTAILEEVKTTPEPKVVDKDYFLHEVKPKETLFGLSKNFKLSQEKLIQLNPELKEGVREGMQLKIPIANALKPEKKEITSIIETVASSKKEIALFCLFKLYAIVSKPVSNILGRITSNSAVKLFNILTEVANVSSLK